MTDTTVKVVAGVLLAIVIVIIFVRRKSKKKTDEDEFLDCRKRLDGVVPYSIAENLIQDPAGSLPGRASRNGSQALEQRCKAGAMSTVSALDNSSGAISMRQFRRESARGTGGIPTPSCVLHRLRRSSRLHAHGSAIGIRELRQAEADVPGGRPARRDSSRYRLGQAGIGERAATW